MGLSSLGKCGGVTGLAGCGSVGRRGWAGCMGMVVGTMQTGRSGLGVTGRDILLDRLRAVADRLKQDTVTLYFAGRHPRTPWYAKAAALSVAAYALSPIDLVPDFVPVLGYLDDLLLVPLGIAMSIRLVPSDVLGECRQLARERLAFDAPSSRSAAVVILLVWVAFAALLAEWLVRLVWG